MIGIYIKHSDNINIPVHNPMDSFLFVQARARVGYEEVGSSQQL